MNYKYWIAGLILISRNQLLSQTAVYPLHVGDLWQYREDSGPGPHLFSRQVLSDTVFPNGRTYAVIHEWDQWSGYLTYERASWDSVFVYNTYMQREDMIYDFSRSVGDTVAIFPRFFDTTVIVLYDYRIVNFFGQNRGEWTFYIDWLIHGLDDEESRSIIDSIGLTGSAGFGYWRYFQGAIINGIQYGTILSVNGNDRIQPATYSLHQNYPNPFNPRTTIAFQILSTSKVILKVFDLLGREVVTLLNQELDPGTHKIEFDAKGLASGVYYYRLQAGNFMDTKKLILLR